jgi:hypothetical protein
MTLQCIVVINIKSTVVKDNQDQDVEVTLRRNLVVGGCRNCRVPRRPNCGSTPTTDGNSLVQPTGGGETSDIHRRLIQPAWNEAREQWLTLLRPHQEAWWLSQVGVVPRYEFAIRNYRRLTSSLQDMCCDNLPSLDQIRVSVLRPGVIAEEHPFSHVHVLCLCSHRVPTSDLSGDSRDIARL